MGIYRKELFKLACEVRNVFPEQGTSQMISTRGCRYLQKERHLGQREKPTEGMK